MTVLCLFFLQFFFFISRLFTDSENNFRVLMAASDQTMRSRCTRRELPNS